MTARRLITVAGVVVIVTAGLAARRVTGDGSHTRGLLGPGTVTVTLTIHHSRFQPDHLDVAPGTTVTFVVDNEDPINHELIVGDADVHRRHETGTEPVHPPRPGEVSVPAGTTAQTTFRFDAPGDVLYACHLPGHFRYGMFGHVQVVAT